MTDLPTQGLFTNAAATNGQAKQAQDDLRDRAGEMPGGAAMSELTIAAGSVTPPKGALGQHSIDTESDAATDDLTNIDQSNAADGAWLLLRNDTNGRTPTVKHGATGTGQILLADGADLALDDTEKHLLLRREGTDWLEVGRFLGPGWFGNKVATVESLSAAKTLARGDDGKLFLCDATGGAFTVTLPPLTGAGAMPNGTMFGFRRVNAGANKVTIDGDGTDIVELDQTYELLTDDHLLWLRADGVKWQKVQENRSDILFKVMAAGAGAWARPAGVKTAKEIWLYGGGGSGGSGGGGAGNGGVGGGAGGAAAKLGGFDVSGKTIWPYVIGAGGAAVTLSNTAGNAGGNSMFDTTVLVGNGGGGGAEGTNAKDPGDGGTASGGDINITGADGEVGTATLPRGTAGGSPGGRFAGCGGRGGGQDENGTAGSGPGAGGGGGGDGSTNNDSGAAADGAVFILY